MEKVSIKPQKPFSPARQAKHVRCLYVVRATLKSERAIGNVERMCEQHLKGRYDLDVIDIREKAHLAREAQIVSVPTLIKRLPLPFQRLVGDMSNPNQVLFGLDLRIQG
jgi:circadian clock protein KaiB